MVGEHLERGKQKGAGGRRYGQRFLPLVVWLGAIVGVFCLLPNAARTGPIVGMVETQRAAVMVPIAGTLATISVQRHQDVEAGQVVGRLSDEDLKLRLAAARCELESLRADLREREAELAHADALDGARRQLDVATEMRRRTSDLEGARLDELETQAEIAEARVRLQGLVVEVERQTTLERQGIASDTTLLRMRTEQDALQKRVHELEGVLTERRARVAAVRQRQDEFTAIEGAHLPLDTFLEPMRWRLKTQEAELERIALEGRTLDLVAPVSGNVEVVHFAPGQWIAGGSTLLTIVDPTARRIFAYVPEAARARVHVTSRVNVIRAGVAGQRPSTVLSMSPSVVRVPERFWLDPQREEWAWEVVVAAGGNETPGERVSLLPIE